MSEEIEVVGHLLTRSPKFQDRLVKSEEGAAQAFLARGEGAIEPVMTVSQHNRIVEQKNQRIEHLESAWHADVIERKDRIIADQERENDRLKAELEQCKRDAERVREALEAISFAAVDMIVPRSAIRTAALNALSAQSAQGCGACGDGCPGKQCRVKEESPPVDLTHAYEGAREDLAIWKRRALEAEARLREVEQHKPRPTGLSEGWNRVRQADGFVVAHSSLEPEPRHKEQALADGYVYVPFLVSNADNLNMVKPEIPAVLFDGHAVYQAISDKARHRTSAENVSDVLDAVVHILRAAEQQAEVKP